MDKRVLVNRLIALLIEKGEGLTEEELNKIKEIINNEDKKNHLES